ncbi:MAG: cytochrome c biogenesis CcdA family protein [Bowdeniella nasicola]|nr:cytochrome c biogenesis CcdA family protein [Bowdeniella nasicola]
MVDIGLGGAFLGGIATLFSPCAAMLLPGFFAYAFASSGRLLAKTGVFYLGLLTTLVPLGALAGSLGRLVVHYRSTLITVSAVLVIVLGIALAAGLTFRLPGASLLDRVPDSTARSQGRQRDPASTLAVYLMGLTYGVAGGCSGPILGSILTFAGLGASAAYGALLLAIYALGMLVPLIVLSALWDRFRLAERSWLRPRPLTFGPVRTTLASVISGLLFVAIGVLLLVTRGTQNAAGLLTADQQVSLESSLREAASAVPDALVLTALAFLAVLAALVWAVRRERRA